MKITLKWLQGITLFKDFETIFAFSLLNSLTDHYFGQILSRLVVFLSDDELIFLLLFETMISQACKQVLRPPKPCNVSNCPFFAATQPQFSHVCLSSCWEMTRISLTFAQKQALVLGRPGIRNSLIWVSALKSLMENANWRRWKFDRSVIFIIYILILLQPYTLSPSYILRF